MSWLTRSKAFFISRKTVTTTCGLLITWSQLLHNSVNAEWQDWLGRKPDGDWLNRLRPVRSFSKCLWVCRSIRLESSDSIDMGQQLFGSLKSFRLGGMYDFRSFCVRTVGKTYTRHDMNIRKRLNYNYMGEPISKGTDWCHPGPSIYCSPSWKYFYPLQGLSLEVYIKVANRERERGRDGELELEFENSNSKTLFHKEYSLGLFKTCLTSSLC